MTLLLRSILLNAFILRHQRGAIPRFIVRRNTANYALDYQR
jgi:hypothetical protein